MTISPLASRIRETIRRDPIGWASTCGVNLRPYQREIALAVKESILKKRGLTFVVILPRQSGKNELQSHIFSWLLFRSARLGGRIVTVSPTFKPQTLNNMDRVRHSLDTCIGTRGRWYPSSGYMFCLSRSRLQFFSGEPTARVVGATADLLLSVDEAQDIDPAKFDKDFDPMTASSNATRIFWGTAWTSDTLLERQRRLALQAEKQDGLRRVFFYTADDIRRLVPSYGAHVDRVIQEKGRNHPLVHTQYFCETIDAQSGMFTPSRLALIFPSSVSTVSEVGTSSPLSISALRSGEGLGADRGSTSYPEGTELPSVAPGASATGVGPPPSHAFLLDVAGMDESRLGLSASLNSEGLDNPGRDSTTLTIVNIDLSTLTTFQGPVYRAVHRESWTGENHLAIFGKLKNLAGQWNPLYIVIDATGVGEGLWAMLDRAFPARVIPVKFTAQEKSEVGWRFISIIETGRFMDNAPSDEVRIQYSKCICEILPGPAKTLRWGVPDGTRGPDGGLVHDDYILADSLTSILDRLEWKLPKPFMLPTFIEGYDPLENIYGYGEQF